MIDFDMKDEGTWFNFDDNNPEAGSICLRELSTRELEKIEMFTVKTEKKILRGTVYDDVKTDNQRASRMRWEYCIVDWKNIQIRGEVAECNAANKEKLVNHIPFIKILIPLLEKLSDTNKELEEARVKNCGATPSGGSVKEEKSAETNA